MALIYTRITWALSPTATQIPGVTLGSPLCPWNSRHSIWRGALQEIFIRDIEAEFRCDFNEKESSQTLTKTLILSSNVHTESNYLSLQHGESKSLSKWNELMIYWKISNSNLTQAVSAHSRTRLDVTWMPSQGGGSPIRNLSLQLLGFINSLNGWNPTDKV